MQDVNGFTRLLRALVTEISILSPSTAAAESLARVSWVGEASPSAAAVSSDHAVAGETILPNPGVPLRCHFETEIVVR